MWRRLRGKVLLRMVHGSARLLRALRQLRQLSGVQQELLGWPEKGLPRLQYVQYPGSGNRLLQVLAVLLLADLRLSRNALHWCSLLQSSKTPTGNLRFEI